MELLIYTDTSKPRIIYTFEFVFRYVLDLKIKFTANSDFFIQNKGRKINYSDHSFSSKGLHIVPSQFLHQSKISKPEILYPLLHHLPSEAPNEVDPFSIIFFMISRYEEYTEYQTDQHDRFSSTQSFAYKKNVLELPIVDIWISWIKDKLNVIYHEYHPIPSPAYRFIPTYDIDHVRAYLWKGMMRTIGGFAKSTVKLKGKDLVKRVKTLTRLEKDPYDVFEYLDKIHQKHELSPIYFWLLGDLGEYDKNPNYKKKEFRNAIKKVASENSIGIHPSYNSFLNSKQIKEEIKRLSKISGLTIRKNRFHFLRFQLPKSYQMLLDQGIEEDYSMAFADALGFRAGTSHSFFWYNLEQEYCTKLKIHPFQIMDVSLKNYLDLSKEASIEKSILLIQQIKTYGGSFVSLWHNSSFDEIEWIGWKDVYEQIVNFAQDGSIPNS